MVKQYLQVGRIVSTHGVRGELRVQPWCDSPDYLCRFSTLYFDSEGREGRRVRSCRPHGNITLLALEGVDSLEDANTLRGRILYMDRMESGIGENEWFIEDLLGCRVLDESNGRLYGTLKEVSQTGANDVWHILAPDGREYLLPAIPDVIRRVSPEAEEITITPLKGIFDDEN